MEIHVNGLDGYLRQPEGGSAMGVLLLPMITGVNPFVQEAAAKLAGAGFTALAWEPYSGQPHPKDQAESLAMSQKLLDKPALAEQSIWLTYMLEELGNRSVGVLGWCLGGRYALLLPAQDRRLRAAVAYHPSIVDPPFPNQEMDAAALVGEIQCPLQVLYPNEDRVTSRATFNHLAESLLRMQAPLDLQLYPGADHGFTGPNAQSNPANVLATKIAWPSTVSFLRSALEN